MDTHEDIPENVDVKNVMQDKEKLRELFSNIKKDRRFVSNIVRTITENPELESKAHGVASKLEMPTTMVAKTKDQIKEAKRIQLAQEMNKVKIPDENVLCVMMAINGNVSSYDINREVLQSDMYVMHTVLINKVPFVAVAQNTLVTGKNWKRNKLAEKLINDTSRLMNEDDDSEVKGPIIFVKLKIDKQDNSAEFEDYDVFSFKDLLLNEKKKK